MNFYDKPLEFFIGQSVQIRLSTIINKALKEGSSTAERILRYLLCSGDVDAINSRSDFYFLDLDESHSPIVRFGGSLQTTDNYLSSTENLDNYRAALVNAYKKAVTDRERDYIESKLTGTYTEEYALAYWLHDANLINTEKGDEQWEFEEKHGIDRWNEPEHSKYIEFARDLLMTADGAVIRDVINKIGAYRMAVIFESIQEKYSIVRLE